MANKQPKNMTFEETLKELDSIVSQLESGDVALDSALSQFERGIALARHGQKTLIDAQQRVDILLANDTTTPLSPFDVSDNES